MKILTASMVFLMGLFSTTDLIKLSLSPAATPAPGKECQAERRVRTTPAGDALPLIRQWLQPLYRPDTGSAAAGASESCPQQSRIPLRNTLINTGYVRSPANA
jgi:hypothetical protein